MTSNQIQAQTPRVLVARGILGASRATVDTGANIKSDAKVLLGTYKDKGISLCEQRIVPQGN